MSESEKVHILVNELLPLYTDLENEVKGIIDEHLKTCSICFDKTLKINDTFEYNPLEVIGIENEKDINEIKPFKKLLYFKRTLFTFSFAIRILIIAMIAYFSYNIEQTQQTIITVNIILFYFPYVSAIDAIHFIFFRNRWFWIILSFDILILLFFDEIIEFIVF